MRIMLKINFFFVILADDTQKLNQQENEIRKYQNQIEQQQKLCQQHTHSLNKQHYAIKKYSSMNNELCVKVDELTQYKEECEVLKGIKNQYQSLSHEYKQLQKQIDQERKEMKDLSKSFEKKEKELNELKKENCTWQEKYFTIDKKLKEKELLLKKFESRLQDYQKQHGKDIDELNEHENVIRYAKLNLSEQKLILSSGLLCFRFRALLLCAPCFNEHVRTHESLTFICTVPRERWVQRAQRRRERKRKRNRTPGSIFDTTSLNL